MKATKAQQHKAVGEGLALGAWMIGIAEVNGQKLTLELDFRAAWRDSRLFSFDQPDTQCRGD